MLGGEMTLDGIGKQLATIQGDLSAMKRDMADVKHDVSALKDDVSGLKDDVSGLKDDVSGLKQDVSGLKQDVSGLKQDVSGLKQDGLSLKQELASMRKDLGGQMLSVLDRLDGLDHYVKVEFEQVKGPLRFGLEAREALRETMELRFAEADHKHDEQIDLLKDVLRSARA
jgi:uncharacterized protein YoxC